MSEDAGIKMQQPAADKLAAKYETKQSTKNNIM